MLVTVDTARAVSERGARLSAELGLASDSPQGHLAGMRLAVVGTALGNRASGEARAQGPMEERGLASMSHEGGERGAMSLLAASAEGLSAFPPAPGSLAGAIGARLAAYCQRRMGEIQRSESARGRGQAARPGIDGRSAPSSYG